MTGELVQKRDFDSPVLTVNSSDAAQEVFISEGFDYCCRFVNVNEIIIYKCQMSPCDCGGTLVSGHLAILLIFV